MDMGLLMAALGAGGSLLRHFHAFISFLSRYAKLVVLWAVAFAIVTRRFRTIVVWGVLAVWVMRDWLGCSHARSRHCGKTCCGDWVRDSGRFGYVGSCIGRVAVGGRGVGVIAATGRQQPLLATVV